MRTAKSSPRIVVFGALGSLRNNREQMKYDAYRRQGLPIVSSRFRRSLLVERPGNSTQ
jgi:hypothetical protein